MSIQTIATQYQWDGGYTHLQRKNCKVIWQRLRPGVPSWGVLLVRHTRLHAQKDPMISLMLCCCYLEILDFDQAATHFEFALSLANNVAGPGGGCRNKSRIWTNNKIYPRKTHTFYSMSFKAPACFWLQLKSSKKQKNNENVILMEGMADYQRK